MTTNNVINNNATKVIQMVYVNGAGSTTSSGSATDITGSSISITPTSASNNILICASFEFSAAASNSGNTIGAFQCVRTASVIGGTPYSTPGIVYGAATSWFNTATFVFLDSPATTSAITYKFQQYVSAPGGSPYNVSSSNGTVILMEVKP